MEWDKLGRLPDLVPRSLGRSAEDGICGNGPIRADDDYLWPSSIIIKPGTGFPNAYIMSFLLPGVKALFVVTSVTKDSYGGTKIQCHATQGKNFPADKESQDF